MEYFANWEKLALKIFERNRRKTSFCVLSVFVGWLCPCIVMDSYRMPWRGLCSFKGIVSPDIRFHGMSYKIYLLKL
jgi:hypothetical protein